MTVDNAAEKILVDAQLLKLVVMSLVDAGYATERISVGDLPGVLAENFDNIVLATTTVTVRDLVRAEAALSHALVERVSRTATGSKRWDAYVAVLTSQAAEADVSETLFGLTYNLRHLRRLLKVGVDPTVAGVRRALRALLPLTSAGSLASLDMNPLHALAQRLVDNGMEADSVNRAVTQFTSLSSNVLPVAEDDDDV